MKNTDNASTIQELKLTSLEKPLNDINITLSNSIEQLEATLASLKQASDAISTLYEKADTLVK